LNQLLYWDGSNWVTLNPGSNGQVLSICNGTLGWVTMAGACNIPAALSTINCAGATTTGTLTSGTAANGVSTAISYTGGNAGTYSAQNVASTGVTGLTATLAAGTLANGAGSVTYTITGTPASAGTASFAITVGGQSCSFTVNVAAAQPQYPANTVNCNGVVTVVNDVTNPTTGKTWMDRNLGASQVATSSTDQNAYGDLYQWGRRADGHQCRTSPTTATLSSVDQPAHGNFILSPNAPYDWRSPQNTNLWQGVNGVNNPCPSGYRLPNDAELTAEILSWGQQNSLGAFASPLKWTLAGHRNYNSGSLFGVGSFGYYWCSTFISANSHRLGFDGVGANLNHFYRTYGGSVRCIKETVGSVGAINCGGATTSGNLFSGSVASNVSTSVPYTSGNGGFYAAQNVSSTGVTGLTATLAAGTLANGNGSVTYTITGTPASSGTASFAITVGGQSCSFTVNVAAAQPQYPANTVNCNGVVTVVNDVTNPTTGKTWMDRNLGASQVATSSTDQNAYGDLYQWGRRADGHQCRTSPATVTLSSMDQPVHGDFIQAPNAPNDWRSPQNNNLWQGVNGVNNPCPLGYRVPTDSELDNERLSWGTNNISGAFASLLKWTVGGSRVAGGANFVAVSSEGYYWTSSISGSLSNVMWIQNNSNMYSDMRADALSLRCIKETVGAVGAINCGGATTTGTLSSGTAANGVSTAISYTGGNAGTYSAQNVSSTGVTGLTATLAAGTLANGAGSVTYTITGTPASAGTASFAITVGGQSCSFTVNVAAAQPQYPANTVNCNGVVTLVNDVTNPTTGLTWMDRNLGASQVATSSTDQNAYGDLYQWGRRADGHQCRTSPTTATLSSVDQPAHGNFILATNSPHDWRSPQNTNLWQGVNGVNNPCPSGYRLPTETELNIERLSWSQNTSVGAFASPLKWTVPGGRHQGNGSLFGYDGYGYYWSSTLSGTNSRRLYPDSSNAIMSNGNRAEGGSVRCVKD
jgi:uncharacterized protein (TIGR02145 family)